MTGMVEGRIAPKSAERPDVSVYWAPGCSSCLKLKEFVEEAGIEFESVNVHASPDALEEIMASGLRGVPVLRRGTQFVYGQNLDEVAAVLGVSRNHTKLSHGALVQRWADILDRARAIVHWFPEDVLERRAILVRDRPIRNLCTHIFQIPETFLLMIAGRIENEREHMASPRAEIVTRDDLHSYVDRITAQYHEWRSRGGETAIPDRMITYYGDQSSAQVLERGVWHSAQHARQLDTIAAGLGAEYHIAPEYYAGLPMPQRLWV
jgi:glutaredoxin